MTNDDALVRARLIVAIRAELRAGNAQMIAVLDGALRQVTLPNHRVSGIANSLSWHASRQEPEQRVSALVAELQRLLARAEAEERAIYGQLLDQVGRADAPAGWEARVIKQLGLPEAARPRWTWEARLLYAQMLMEIVATLTRGEGLRQELEQQGGSVRWQ